MGPKTNTRSIKSLRRLTRSRTQVIFFDGTQIMKSDEGMRPHLPGCKDDTEEEVPSSRSIPKTCNILNGEERMFSFKDLLETFNSLEGGMTQKTSRLESNTGPIESLNRDTMMKRKEMFDHPSNDVFKRKGNMDSLSKKYTRD
ncbi:hypothetical protein EROM_100250 [Encephalitozoon romaleae SJ-2008]|uniref:Uncharacterized protein n=1 Tax=Encephalitozoon romaleae (strain SJ-2008) TaxID=1178016 RepID=I7ATN9_ENCRO|nr:hypothetical protein EROM_100250 [Encephalitozoon romaleae SJ-2008]AFN83842.1 hypothetical protein EROM_100250 [Encephalitozoon romaleae SJ-2008]